jgi:DNA-binding MarR family transcriptional regulator
MKTTPEERGSAIEEIVRHLPRRNGQLARLLARHARSTLPRGMASILGAVDGAPRSITQLAEREGLAQPTVTRMVGRLHALGLVERLRDPADRRVVLVQLTPAGKAELRRLRARYRAVLRRYLSELGPGELAELGRASEALQRLIDALQGNPGVNAGSGRRPGRRSGSS